MSKFVFCIVFLLASTSFARFFSVDPKREFHNPYFYVGNNPVSAIDPNGEEIFFMHGTWQDSTQFKGPVRATIGRSLSDVDSGYAFGSKLSLINRRKAAKHLFKAVKTFHEANPDAPINLVGQSHGGNVFMHGTFLKLVRRYNESADSPIEFDNVILLNTPIRTKNQPDHSLMKRVVLVSVENDSWQKAGGVPPGSGRSTLPPPAINIQVSSQNINDWFKAAFGVDNPSKGDIHMQSANHSGFWDTFVKPVLESLNNSI